MKQRIISLFTAVAVIAALLPCVTAPAYATQSNYANFNTGYTLTGEGGADIVAVAMAQEGLTGTALGYTEEWCADFVADCARLAGQSDAIPAYGEVYGQRERILNNGGTVVTGTAAPGDICFLNRSGSNNYDHVEIVYRVVGSRIYTIGGNSGSYSSLYTRRVERHEPIPADQIIEIVRPDYSSSTVVAPSWAAISASRTDISTDTQLTLSFSSDTASSYSLRIYKQSKLYAQIDNLSNTYSLSFSEQGEYSAYCIAKNSSGSVESSWVRWVVWKAPAMATVTADHYITNVGQPVTFTFASDYAQRYKLQIYKGATLFFEQTELAGAYTLSFTDASMYTVRVYAYNNAGGVNSSFISVLATQAAPLTASLSDEHVYVLYKGEYTRNDAQMICEQFRGHLATITSEQEQELIKSMVSTGELTDYFWLGGTDEAEEGTWEWVTDEAFDYEHWAPGQPNDLGGTQNYLRIHKTGYWDDASSDKTYGFICEYDTASLTPAQTILFEGRAYELYNNPISWNAANQTAISRGGHLVTITSEQEQAALQAAATNGVAYWTGLTYTNANGFGWNTGEPYSYTNWAPGKPQLLSHNTTDDYAVFNSGGNGLWSNCGELGGDFEHYGFIIEYDNPDTYTVTYNANGGKTDIPAQTKFGGTDIILTDAVPTYTGYIFAGWALSANATTAQYQPGETYSADADAVLYAVWQQCTHKSSAQVQVGTKLLHPHNIILRCNECKLEYDSDVATVNQRCPHCVYSYTVLDNGTIQIDSYSGNLSAVTITPTIDSYEVYSLKTAVFMNNNNITEIDIIDGVQKIGGLAFLGCSSLKEITIPASVQEIGAYAFYNCASDFIIYCFENSAAHTYALENNIPFELIKLKGSECTFVDWSKKTVFTYGNRFGSASELVTALGGSTVSGNPAIGRLFGTGSTINLTDASAGTQQFRLIMAGDVDGSGVVDCVDAMLAELTGSGNKNLNDVNDPYGVLRCANDLDGDGNCDSVDVSLIMSMVVQ